MVAFVEFLDQEFSSEKPNQKKYKPKGSNLKIEVC